jgi:CBS domain containing-hemolysin-like protein
MNVVGVLTFENVLEAILQIKILDERDRDNVEKNLHKSVITKSRPGVSSPTAMPSNETKENLST